MKKVLITGANGRIGTFLAERLGNEYELFLLDRMPLEEKNSSVVDLSSFDETMKVFEEIGVLDCVIHLAGDSSTDASWDSVLWNNVVATYNVFEISRIRNVKKVIFASSNHVTGRYESELRFKERIYEGRGNPKISIEDELRPDSLYGVSKVFGEQIGRYYSEKFGISFICFRIGTFNEVDRPLEQRHLATWVSHRDFLQLVEGALASDDIDFGVYYAVSDNSGRIWDISNAKRELGYKPEDSAEDLWEED